MNTRAWHRTFFLLLSFGCACGWPPATQDSAETDNPWADQLSSNLKRRDDTTVPRADLRTLAEHNSQFAWRLYRELRREGEDNVLFSPVGLALNLAMIYAGAAGETKAQMAEALEFSLPDGRLHEAFGALERAVTGGRPGAEVALGKGLWLQSGCPLLPSYLDRLALDYGSAVYLTDFMSDPEATRRAINAWMERETAGGIVDFVPEGLLRVANRLFAATAVAFDGMWDHPFDPARTEDLPFTLEDGRTTPVPLMRKQGYLRFAAGDWGRAVELPYVGGELAFVALLPPPGSTDLATELTSDTMSRVVDSLEETSIVLSLPRFRLEFQSDMSRPLRALGITDAFSKVRADLSAMNGADDLFLETVLHAAVLEVSEDGTEAYAGSGAVVTQKGGDIPQAVVFDRPFLFWIRHVSTNTTIFFGRFAQPG